MTQSEKDENFKEREKSENSLIEELDTLENIKKPFWTDYVFHPPVYFILFITFCERFAYYAITAIFIIYFTSQLNFTSSKAVLIYHGVSVIGYLTPIIGAIISDNYLGRYKTMIIFISVFVAGSLLLTLSTIPVIQNAIAPTGPIIGIVLVMLGMGSLKPCITTFGADQFTENEQNKIQTYFSILYLSFNVGATLSYLVAPLLRSKVTCFGNDCYFLAFGFPSLLLITVLVVFLSGTKYYRHKPIAKSAIYQIIKVTYYATVGWIKNFRKSPKRDFLDYAEKHTDKRSIDDAKCLYRIISIFITIPMFWALFLQQGSLWTIQAIKMSGYLGSAGYMIPDQMQLVNPLLVIIFIPIMNAVYSLIQRCNVKVEPFKKMFAGMILSAISFLISGGIEILIRNDIGTLIDLNHGFSGLQVYNGISFPIVVSSSANIFNETQFLRNSEYSKFFPILAETNGTLFINTFTNPVDNTTYEIASDEFKSDLKYTAVVYRMDGETKVKISEFKEEIDSSGANIRFIFVPGPSYSGDNKLTLRVGNLVTTQELGIPSQLFNVPFGSNDAIINNVVNVPVRYDPGGIYTLIVTMMDHNNIRIDAYVDIEASNLHMLLQVPQYIVITIGEILLSITGLTFAYESAPKRIKVAITSAWLLTNAFGNIIILVVEAIFGDASGSTVQFIFAGLMFVVSLIFGAIAYFYKPHVSLSDDFNSKENELTKDDSS